MHFFISCLIILLLPGFTRSGSSSSRSFILPPSDRFLHLYSLPVGQGDSIVIQCPAPHGHLSILDMGSTDGNSGGAVWKGDELKRFLKGHFGKIRNLVITHNHDDHFNLIDDVFDTKNSTRSLEKIHISCKKSHLSSSFKKWIKKFHLEHLLSTFNGGKACGPNGVDCGLLRLCENSNIPIQAKVLTANWGQQCTKQDTNSSVSLNKNTDSIVISLKIGNIKLLLNGDFEDFTSNSLEYGPQRNLTEFYGSELLSHVYHISHHGASNLANKDIILEAVRPKAVFVSSNPYAKFRHPRCSVFDRLKSLKSLCKPLSTAGETSYCGPHPMEADREAWRSLLKKKRAADGVRRGRHGGSFMKMKEALKLQEAYTCGEEKGLRNVSDNQYAIYTTVVNEKLVNVVELRSDGVLWGFVNHFFNKTLIETGRRFEGGGGGW